MKTGPLHFDFDVVAFYSGTTDVEGGKNLPFEFRFRFSGVNKIYPISCLALLDIMITG